LRKTIELKAWGSAGNYTERLLLVQIKTPNHEEQSAEMLNRKVALYGDKQADG
jgi:hypothetical protein